MYGVNYEQKDYKSIFEAYLRKAAANKLINNDEQYIQDILNSESIENILIMDLAIHSEILTEIYQDIADISSSYDLAQATGQNLDQLLEPFILRRKSTHANVKIRFTKKNNNNTSEITIPSHTQVTSNKYPEITFETTEDTIIPTKEDNTLVNALCTIPGPEGNIPPGELNTLTNNLSAILEVSNQQSAIGGRNREDDNSYRLRGQGWTSINTQGTYKAYKNAIEDVAAVEDYHIQRQWDGPGTTRITINPPTKEVLETVKKAIQEVCAVDEEYTIVAATNHPINITLSLTIKTYQENPPGELEKEEIKQEVQNAIKTYIEGKYVQSKGKIGGLRLGEEFIPSRAAAHIINTLTQVKDLQIKYPTSIIKLNHYQKAICGEISIEIKQ